MRIGFHAIVTDWFDNQVILGPSDGKAAVSRETIGLYEESGGGHCQYLQIDHDMDEIRTQRGGAFTLLIVTVSQAKWRLGQTASVKCQQR